MKKLIYIVLLAFILSSCGTSTTQTNPTVDTGSIQTAAVNTMMAGINQTLTASAPTDTPIPPIPPTATIVPAEGNIFSWNYLAEQDSGGLKIQVGRVVIAEKTALLLDGIDFSGVAIFDDKPVVVEIVFIITNTTSNEISVYTNQGTVVVGNEQVNLLDYAFSGAEFGENFSGNIFPGVRVIGGIWFGLKRTQLSDIQSLTIAISGPADAKTLTRLGPEYRIFVDLSQRKNEPLPEELK